MFYVFLASGFEEVEALAPVDLLRRAKIEVRTVGVTGKTVTGSHGIPVTCDCTMPNLALNDSLTGIILPGGMPGTTNLDADAGVDAAIKFAAENGKLLCAICAAPMILGRRGLLSGKKATCHPGFENELRGAEFVLQPAVTDGNIITARGAGAAWPFAAAIVEKVTDAATAAALLQKIQWK